MRIRKATVEDASLLLDLIKEKAEFDRQMKGFFGEVTTTVNKIESTLFGPQPFAHAILLEVDNRVHGFALYHYRYSSFSGTPSVWLDDLLVVGEYRSKGYGRHILKALFEIAEEHSVSHISWTASPLNKRAHQFYVGLGATIERWEGERPYFHWLINTK
ncbi:GNAT family N-acetyltransferase [Vibrio penaeicida]|uniref:GNAT family N-acetyltransferase n=1 Tax=Vibrio penaeicida TaxID=104609 RepID=UPI000CE9FDAD|nr:GNAT family N-acetyltransferase [Vibrio penaeicida]